MHWRSFIAGLLIGGITTGSAFVLKGMSHALDAGMSLTYAHAEMDTLRRESDVLKKMAEPNWLGLPASEAQIALAELDLFSFEKGSEGFAAGPVFLRLQNDAVVEIQTYCARFIHDGCKDEGVN